MVGLGRAPPVPLVTADCDGMLRAISLSEWTYLTWSMNGMSTLRPGVRMRLNLPNRSTTHASWCGTNLMTWCTAAPHSALLRPPPRQLPAASRAGNDRGARTRAYRVDRIGPRRVPRVAHNPAAEDGRCQGDHTRRSPGGQAGRSGRPGAGQRGRGHGGGGGHRRRVLVLRGAGAAPSPAMTSRGMTSSIAARPSIPPCATRARATRWIEASSRA